MKQENNISEGNLVDVPPEKMQQTMCAVTIDGQFMSSDDFVAVLSKSNGSATLLFQTDALTLGIAISLITKAFKKSLAQCPEEEQQNIKDILFSKDEQEDSDE